MCGIEFTNNQIRNLIARLDQPDRVYVAAAGPEYGFVRAWKLDQKKYLVEVSCGVIEYCEVFNGFENPYEYLEDPTGVGIDDPIEKVIRQANVRGIDTVKLDTSSESAPFVVLETRYYYGAREKTHAVKDDTGDIRKFDFLSDACDFVTLAEADKRPLTNDEYAEPKYTIVSIGKV